MTVQSPDYAPGLVAVNPAAPSPSRPGSPGRRIELNIARTLFLEERLEFYDFP